MAGLSVRDLFVLGRVSSGTSYGYEIMRDVRMSRADLWVELSEKHVYYVLRKLADAGLVSATERPGRGSSRTVYHITPAGREALAAQLRAEESARTRAYDDFDAAFATMATTEALDDEARTAMLKRRLAELERRLGDEYRRGMRSTLERRFGATARALYEKGRAMTMAERTWLQALIGEVERDGWDGFGVPAGLEDGEADEES
jgi:DNA-binding PadR family transcriptional regulator